MELECREVTLERWNDFFSEEGRILHEYVLRKSVFLFGCEPAVRPQLWPLLLGVLPFAGTFHERECLRMLLQERYVRLRQLHIDQMNALRAANQEHLSEELSPETARMRMLDSGSHEDPVEKSVWTLDMISRTDFLRNVRVIDADVPRTDSDNPFFQQPEVQTAVRNILLTHLLHDPELAYWQGMNDLLTPILEAVQDEALSFWLFAASMKRVRNRFLADGVLEQLKLIGDIIRHVDIRLYQVCTDNGKDVSFLFIYRWLLVDFKREFRSEGGAAILWDMIWAEYGSPCFQLFVAASMLLLYRQELFAAGPSHDNMLECVQTKLPQIMSPVAVADRARKLLWQCRNDPSCPLNISNLIALTAAPPPMMGFQRANANLPPPSSSTMKSSASSRPSSTTQPSQPQAAPACEPQSHIEPELYHSAAASSSSRRLPIGWGAAQLALINARPASQQPRTQLPMPAPPHRLRALAALPHNRIESDLSNSFGSSSDSLIPSSSNDHSAPRHSRMGSAIVQAFTLPSLGTKTMDASYDEWAEHYDTQKNRTRDMASEVLQRDLTSATPGRVVEAGCGTGRNTAWLCLNGWSVTGLDFSKNMLAVARQRLGENSQAHFHQCDICQPWPVPPGHADLVTIDLVLEHIKKPSLVFEHAFTALKPSGMMHITEFHYARIARGAGAQVRPDSSKLIGSYVHDFESLVAAATSAGFCATRVRHILDSGEELDAELPGTLPRLLVIEFVRR